MTLKTSFFNKGIYKSTLKRYLWGSVLYFVLLFLSSGFAVLMVDDSYQHSYGFILSEYMFMAMLMAAVVPTITAFLVFRWFHSRPQAIFMFSLPATRSAGVVSAFLGGLTLMFVPVVLNGMILLAISRGGYDWYLTTGDCFAWMGYNILGLFMLFSCAMFSVSITGNAFSGIVINILLHSFFSICMVAFEAMTDTFIYGFTYNNTLATMINDNNFMVVLFGFTSEYFRENHTVWKVIGYIGESVVLCVLAYIMFLKRKLQTASEVSGFKCLNGIFKYTITFLTALLTFGLFEDGIVTNAGGVFVIMVMFSLIAYTACEMVIKKTLNVFYAWKGYVSFCVIFGLMVAFFSGTSFFGYETRIPEAADVQSVSLYDWNYADDVFVADENVIDSVVEIHSQMTENIPVLYTDDSVYDEYDYGLTMYISYKLKNGKTMSREYNISRKAYTEYISTLYENEAYKKANEPAFLDYDKFKYVEVSSGNFTGNINDLVDALREDILKLDYKSIHPESTDYPERPETRKIIYLEYESDKIPMEKNESGKIIIRTEEISVTDEFESTLAYLNEHVSTEKIR